MRVRRYVGKGARRRVNGPCSCSSEFVVSSSRNRFRGCRDSRGRWRSVSVDREGSSCGFVVSSACGKHGSRQLRGRSIRFLIFLLLMKIIHDFQKDIGATHGTDDTALLEHIVVRHRNQKNHDSRTSEDAGASQKPGEEEERQRFRDRRAESGPEIAVFDLHATAVKLWYSCVPLRSETP